MKLTKYCSMTHFWKYVVKCGQFKYTVIVSERNSTHEGLNQWFLTGSSVRNLGVSQRNTKVFFLTLICTNNNQHHFD